MTTYIIGGILLLAFCYAAYRTLFGKGDCCGGCDGCCHCHDKQDDNQEGSCCCHHDH